MKKLLVLATAMFSMAFINKAGAQLKINLSVNIGTQPVWGPTGYDHAEYYYMPDIDAYYYVPQKQFIYLDANRWVFANALPPRFHYDLNTGYKVVVNEPKPYLHPDVYKARYAKFKGGHVKQPIIRDSHEEKYYVIKDHPQHNQWAKQHGGDKDHGHDDHRGH